MFSHSARRNRRLHIRLSRLPRWALAGLLTLASQGASAQVHLWGTPAPPPLCPVHETIGPLDVWSDTAITTSERVQLRLGTEQARRAGVEVWSSQAVYLAHHRDAMVAYLGHNSRHTMGLYDVSRDWVALNARDWPVHSRIVAHELTHAFVSHLMGRAQALDTPEWKEEGLAGYVEWQGAERRTGAAGVVLHHFDDPFMKEEGYFWARTMVATVLGGSPGTPLTPGAVRRLVRDPRTPNELVELAHQTGRLSETDWGRLTGVTAHSLTAH